MRGAARASGGGDGGPGGTISPHHRATLLAHELGQVVGAETALASRAARLPAAEGLRAWPGAGGRAGATVDVEDAGLDRVQEVLDLAAVLAEDAGGEAVVGGVRLLDRVLQRGRASHGQEGQEQ